MKLTNKQFVLKTMKAYGKNMAQTVQQQSDSMTGTQLYEKKEFIPDFQTAKTLKNMLNLNVEYTYVIVFVLFLCSITYILRVKNNIIDIAITFFGLVYVGMFLDFIVLTINNFELGKIYVWLIFIIAFLTDTFAYFVGYLFGKHKLIPDVSPNKSVEGAIGGSVCGSILGTVELVLCESLLGFNLFGIKNLAIEIIVVFLLSLCLTIVSQIGDLIASKLKREYGIKDYSNLFPGHGGIMDRFDSLILTSALFFVILALFGVVLC